MSRRRRPRPRTESDPPLRVVHVINDLACGGAQRMVLQQSLALNRTRFQCTVASLGIDRTPGLEPEFERAGIEMHVLRGDGEPVAAAMARLPGLLGRLKPDIVHTHLAAAGIIGRVAARQCGVPRVLTTLHNLSDWEEKRSHPLRAVDRATMGRAHVIVAVSNAIRDAMTSVMPRLAPRVVTVHNGVPVAAFANARRECAQRRAEIGLPADAFVVGSVARLDARKGLDTLVEAFSWVRPRGRDVRLLLVGDGPEREHLLELAALRGLEGRITLISRPHGAREALAAMDLFVAPSRTEGLGVAIIEALAAGLPVLASDVGGIPEVMIDGHCGRLLTPDQPEAWADAIVGAVTDEATLSRWSAAAAERARAFSIEASVRALELVYVPDDEGVEWKSRAAA